MTDPAHSPVSPPPVPEADGAGAPSRPRPRIFTPMAGAPVVRPKPTGRVTLFAPSQGEELEPLNAPPPPVPPSPHVRLPFTSSPASFSPNPAIPFLQRVHASSNAARLERLVSGLGRLLAWTSLWTGVAAAIASAFVFRSTSSPSTDAAALRDESPRSAPPSSPASLEPVRNLGEAITVLETFLTTPSAHTRREMIESPESLPDPFAREGRVPELADTRIDHANARLQHHPPLAVALVPITDASGLPRTAAIVHKGDRWRIDWRSVLTPEDQDWAAFVNGSIRGVSQYRVQVARQPDGTWTVGRPASGHDHVTASVILGSRVAEELAAELDARGGAPLSADLFLENRAGTPLNIVDWTRDKWSL